LFLTNETKQYIDVEFVEESSNWNYSINMKEKDRT